MPQPELKCPTCGGKVDVEPNRALKGTVTCSRGHTIRLDDKTGGLRSARAAMDKLEKSISKLGKKK